MYTLGVDNTMTTRNQTDTYLKFRAHARHLRSSHAAHDTGVVSGASARLLDADALALEEGRAKGESPAWMSVINEINTDISSIKLKMKKLDEMCREQLVVNFESNDDSNEHQIEAMKTEIIKLMHNAQSKVLKVKQSPTLHTTTPTDLKLRDNVIASIAAVLQMLSRNFVDKQRAYLNNVKSLHVDTFAPDDHMHMIVNGSNTSLQRVYKMNAYVDQRDKDIANIAKSIEELAGMFNDLSLLAIEQGTILDRIDYNCEHTLMNTAAAVVSINDSRKMQRNINSKLCMIVLYVLILVAVLAAIIKATR